MVSLYFRHLRPHVYIWDGIRFADILMRYWVSTWAASIFRARRIVAGVKVQRERGSVSCFLSQLAWHIVKDSSLIILRRWRRPASPFRLSWSTEAKFDSCVCLLCSESDSIMSAGDLIWTFSGVNPTLIFPDPPPRPSPAWPGVFLHYRPEKNSNHHGNTENIKGLSIVVPRRIFPPWHVVQWPPSCSSVAVVLNIHDEVALWFCSWISNWAVKRDTTCP